MRKIAFVNEKGGTCKTTLAVNMAAWFAGKGRRVLLIDLDPQGQSGKSLGIDVRNVERTSAELLLDDAMSVPDAAAPTRIEGLDIIVANKNLTDFPTSAAPRQDRAELLRNKLKGVRGYDIVVFDSPPSLGLVTLNVMLAANEIVIPVNLTYLALDGCAEIVETVETVKANHNKHNLRISMVVPVFYRNTRLANAILAKLREHFAERVSQTVIGFNVTIDEAQSQGRTIWEYAPNSRGAELLGALAREIDAALN
ncbi:ParA family protein [bacterium]|nr:ParA family protein [bacterium]